MPSLRLEPIGITLTAPSNISLLQILQHAKVVLPATCQGKGVCSTCAVKVVAGASALTDITPQEQETLDRVYKQPPPGTRLSCQVYVIGAGLVLELSAQNSLKQIEICDRLIGRIAPQNILHPVSRSLLVPKGAVITKNALERLFSVVTPE